MCGWVVELGTSREGLQENSHPREAQSELAERSFVFICRNKVREYIFVS